MNRLYQFGTMLALLFGVLLSARVAHAELRCDVVTPDTVEKACGKRTHVVTMASTDAGEKECSRLLSADPAGSNTSAGGVSIHLIKTMAPITKDPKWTDVQAIPGFDAAFSFKDEVEPGTIVSGVAASRGGVTVFVNLVGATICSIEQATQLANAALPAPSAEARGTAFEGASPPEMHDGGKLVVTAYAIIWILVTGYLGLLWNTQKGLYSRIDGLERAIDRAERTETKPKVPEPRKATTKETPKAKKSTPAKAETKADDDEDES
jgi:CcmD family protein